MDPRTGLDGAGNLATIEIRSPDPPARFETLYRLQYPGPRRVLTVNARRATYEPNVVYYNITINLPS